MSHLYFDNNATTALDPLVLKEMLVDLEGPPANPSSIHQLGQRAKQLLVNARARVALFFQAKPEEVLFTSSGTESLNLLIKSLDLKKHLITTSIEHSCIYNSIKELEKKGLSVTYLPVDDWGAPLVEDLLKAIQPDTQAIFLSAANSETGVKLDLQKIALTAQEKNIPLHIDAVGLIGKEPFSFFPGISSISISGHKFHGPKGIGALIVKKNVKITPQLLGGAQEYQKRAGTENLAGILGLSKALEIFKKDEENIANSLCSLRDHFESLLQKEIPDALVHGKGPRVSNTSNICFPGIDGETLLIHLSMNKIAASHGSACSSGALEPSRVLLNMGISPKKARSSLRFSFSKLNTKEEIEKGVQILVKLVKKLKG